MSIAAVTRELLVRYLDAWTPGALHSAHGATFLQAGSDEQTAEAALRVFAEFADRLRGRRLTMVVVAPEIERLQARLRQVQDELQVPPQLAVYVVAGTSAAIGVALKAAAATAAPLLSIVEVDTTVDAALLAKGKPAEVLLTAPAGSWSAQREALHRAGFELTAGVELVEGATERLVGFGTRSAKNLEVFKNDIWALDEYAGVRYRDPGDPEGHLMDIALEPNPGALRRELLVRLGSREQTVTELKRFVLTDTIFRATDAVKVITALLHAGAVSRTPAEGRLGGDVVISSSS